MSKNIFEREPLLGKVVSRYALEQSLENIDRLFTEIGKYFFQRLHTGGEVRLHEQTPVCSLIILPMRKGKKMLSVENGSISFKEGKSLVSKKEEVLVNEFFKAFHNEGLRVSFDTAEYFFIRNANPHTDTRTQTGRMRLYKISFALKYASTTEPVMSNLSVEIQKIAITSRKVLKA